jgi:hypothetical protein
MPSPHLRDIDEARIIKRFSSSDGLPLVLERTLQDDHVFVSVEKIDGAAHKLDTVADLTIVPATGAVKASKLINDQGLWRADQLHSWASEAATELTGLAPLDRPLETRTHLRLINRFSVTSCA